MNKERLEKATNSNIEMVPTYHLTKHDKAIDPDLHLIPMLKQNMKKEVEFVGISVGTNDITALNNTPNEQEEKDNLKTCQKQAEFLIETASKVSDDYTVDVYIFQQPPRYDKVEEDKLGNWARYSKLTNSHLAILAASKHRLHLVDNSNLAAGAEQGQMGST